MSISIYVHSHSRASTLMRIHAHELQSLHFSSFMPLRCILITIHLHLCAFLLICNGIWTRSPFASISHSCAPFYKRLHSHTTFCTQEQAYISLQSHAILASSICTQVHSHLPSHLCMHSHSQVSALICIIICKCLHSWASHSCLLALQNNHVHLYSHIHDSSPIFNHTHVHPWSRLSSQNSHS